MKFLIFLAIFSGAHGTCWAGKEEKNSAHALPPRKTKEIKKATNHETKPETDSVHTPYIEHPELPNFLKEIGGSSVPSSEKVILCNHGGELNFLLGFFSASNNGYKLADFKNEEKPRKGIQVTPDRIDICNSDEVRLNHEDFISRKFIYAEQILSKAFGYKEYTTGAKFCVPAILYLTIPAGRLDAQQNPYEAGLPCETLDDIVSHYVVSILHEPEAQAVEAFRHLFDINLLEDYKKLRTIAISGLGEFRGKSYILSAQYADQRQALILQQREFNSKKPFWN